ncbi:MAG TPA: hypothetical protein VIH99_12705 [Bdellovibrionota bacterium]|jgi:hypothetical protein
MTLLFWIFAARLAIAAEMPQPTPALPYTDTNSVQALRNLEALSSRNPAKLGEAEGVEWAKAMFARIALLRLEGKEDRAAEVIAGCGPYCGKWGPGKEWPALKKWGCGRKKAPGFCQKP